MIQALNQVIQQILKESPEKVERWKHILKESLGNNSGLLFSVFPDLKLIIGDVELVEIDDQALAKNRFVLAFKNLIKGFSQEDAPLVIFLDDLQWIDSCLLYTSDAADERSSVDLGGRRIIKKKNNIDHVISRDI